jgi:hypothetical protein
MSISRNFNTISPSALAYSIHAPKEFEISKAFEVFG